MNAAHFHLVVNHLPIIFPIVGIIILLTGLTFKSDAVIRTAFLVFVLGAASSLAAMNSGEGAEDILKQMNSINVDYIERHEDAAELFAVLSYLLGGLSLIGLWASFKMQSLAKIISIAALLFAGVVIFFARDAGTTGGEISHPEIRPEFDATPMIKNDHSEEEDH